MAIALAFALIIFFLIIERRLRKGDQAKEYSGGKEDRGSTKLLGIVFLLSLLVLLLSPVLNYFNLGRMTQGTFINWLGISLIILGISVRVWANRTLGEFYTRTLLVMSEQSVVDRGPYKLIRHPGYLGVILMLVGASLSAANWITIVCITPAVLVAYSYRISSEEIMLISALGQQYKDYVGRTWKLIPFLY